MNHPRTIRDRAPAKINLSLAVRGRQADGFHEIESFAIPIEWFDDLECTLDANLTLDINGTVADMPRGEKNLVWRAARRLAEEAGRPCGARIHLTKRIPVGAGLGGGSSDAAAALQCLNELWGLALPPERLMVIAASLGSDVPFFLGGGPAMLRGRGEQVTPIASAWSGWVAVVVPPYGLATAEVYRGWDRLRPQPLSPRHLRIDHSLTAVELSPHLFNDLEAAAFACEPRLGRLHSLLGRSSGRAVRMTGSGSCLFLIFDTSDEATAWKQRASALLGDGTDIQVVKTGHSAREEAGP